MKPVVEPLTCAKVSAVSAAPLAHCSDYAALTKPRLTLLVVFTAGAGYLLATPGAPDGPRLACLLAGVYLVVGGAAAFNQLLESGRDARMPRTEDRPLPRGRLTIRQARACGLACAAAGLALLAWRTTFGTLALSALGFAVYVGPYAALKTRTAFNTLVGAISGALPPLLGWTAAGGSLGAEAAVLFGLLFCWQLTHVGSLAWVYRDEYARAGVRVLGQAGGGRGTAPAWVVLVSSLALCGVSLCPYGAGWAGRVYLGVALALGLGLIALAVVFFFTRSRPSARRVFLATLGYLPLLLGAWVYGRL